MNVAAKLAITPVALAVPVAVSAWAINTPTLTDGQFIGFPMLAVLAAGCVLGCVWEKRK